MPYFTIPLLLTVQADSYDEAFEYAEDLATGIGFDGENISAEHVNQHRKVGGPHWVTGRHALYFTDKGF